jgi:hypothetical protein
MHLVVECLGADVAVEWPALQHQVAFLQERRHSLLFEPVPLFNLVIKKT